MRQSYFGYLFSSGCCFLVYRPHIYIHNHCGGSIPIREVIQGDIIWRKRKNLASRLISWIGKAVETYWKHCQENPVFHNQQVDQEFGLGLLEHSNFTRICFLISLKRKKESCFQSPWQAFSPHYACLWTRVKWFHHFVDFAQVEKGRAERGKPRCVDVSKLLINRSFSSLLSPLEAIPFFQFQF